MTSVRHANPEEAVWLEDAMNFQKSCLQIRDVFEEMKHGDAIDGCRSDGPWKFKEVDAEVWLIGMQVDIFPARQALASTAHVEPRAALFCIRRGLGDSR